MTTIETTSTPAVATLEPPAPSYLDSLPADLRRDAVIIAGSADYLAAERAVREAWAATIEAGSGSPEHAAAFNAWVAATHRVIATVLNESRERGWRKR